MEVLSYISIIDLELDVSIEVSPLLRKLNPKISAILLNEENFALAKQYWQHTGDGISSRRAEFCHGLFKQKLLTPATSQLIPPDTSQRPFRGPRRYHRPDSSIDGLAPGPESRPEKASTPHKLQDQESTRFVEERFGRNLDLTLAESAKSAIRRRIAGSLHPDIAFGAEILLPGITGAIKVDILEERDVYLFPAGMNAIFTTHRALLAARGLHKSINLGFPYVDTLKVLQKFGPGCLFYGFASDEDLDNLETRLQAGERYLALFCEFPGNPLLMCPDLKRIRRLADEFDFLVVIDETIGTFANIDVLHIADVIVSSLTKIFSGDSNVMGGCAVLNPRGQHYKAVKVAMEECYEDTYWPEDVIFMERNSRDFTSRVERANTNADAICNVLVNHPLVCKVYYPRINASRPNYDAYRLPTGGYGGLLSIVFNQEAHAQAFYDSLKIAKGPSLGTNFTLCSPYVLLAHYQELEWAAKYGVNPSLVRVSVGLEETSELIQTFIEALQTADSAG